MPGPPDAYLLEDLLDDEALAVRDRVRAFVETEVLPIINEHWEAARFPVVLLPGLARLGIVGTTIQGYGCPGLSPLASGMATLEMSRGDGSVNTFVGVQSGLAMGSIALLGDDEQRGRWLPRMATLEHVGAFALTEPDHGSDAVRLQTSVRADGPNLVIEGAKRWIGNAGMAHVMVVWARDVSDGQVTAVVVERGPDGNFPDGLRTTEITGKIGKRAILQADVTLDAVRVPRENRLVHARSFADAGRVLSATRGGAAWESLGHATAAYEIALRYAKERVQFGQPIAGFQLVQHRLASMLSEITAMQLYCVRMAELQRTGRWTGPMASLAKMHHARKARQVCLDARDILGGNGLLLGHHVARHLTDMEVVHTYEGTDSIQALIIGRDLTGLPAFAPGRPVGAGPKP